LENHTFIFHCSRTSYENRSTLAVVFVLYGVKTVPAM
jgi:hypothetical protein